jgi:hypothetical protein
MTQRRNNVELVSFECELREREYIHSSATACNVTFYGYMYIFIPRPDQTAVPQLQRT